MAATPHVRNSLFRHLFPGPSLSSTFHPSLFTLRFSLFHFFTFSLASVHISQSTVIQITVGQKSPPKTPRILMNLHGLIVLFFACECVFCITNVAKYRPPCSGFEHGRGEHEVFMTTTSNRKCRPYEWLPNCATAFRFLSGDKVMKFLHGPLAAALCLSLVASGFGESAASEKAASRPAYSGPIQGDERILHALNRFTFGPRPGDLE